jgi:hypothetical protein
MPRLIDDIRSAGRLGMPWFVLPRHWASWEGHARRVCEVLHDPGLPVLVIDNVAEYFYAGTDQEEWNIERDFPNLAPPFPMFWAEHKLVRTIHSKEYGDTDVTRIMPQGGRVGQLFIAAERDQVTGTDIPESARWILWCELFVDYGKRDVAADGPHGSVFLCIDAEGRIVGNPSMQSYASEQDAEMMKKLIAWFNPTLLAISFLHCKNVTIIDNPVPAKLARRYRERHGGAGLTGFKTLVIEPLKQILRTQGRSGEHGLAKALHICRGHFRDYRQGAGLFGKYHQLVWTPATVRGTKGKGAPPREIEVKV